jgi:hypothetical protein
MLKGVLIEKKEAPGEKPVAGVGMQGTRFFLSSASKNNTKFQVATVGYAPNLMKIVLQANQPRRTHCFELLVFIAKPSTICIIKEVLIN